MSSEEQSSMEEELSFPMRLADRIRKSVEEAESFKQECSEVGVKVERLFQMLRSTFRFASSSSLYERPVRRIVSEVSRNLERALTLTRKCKRSGVLRRVVTITSAADFRKLFNSLDASIADMKWLLSVFEYSTDSNSNSNAAGGNGNGIVLSMPPIASTDPILSWVWSFIAAIQMSSLIDDRLEAANELASLASDNDRNKKIIVEEGGISPLLKLLKETVSPNAQVAAATALAFLATDQERVRLIVAELGVPIIVHVLWDSPMLVQIAVANLVSRMAENDSDAREEFARENAIRPLVSLLSTESMFLDDPKLQSGKPTTLHSLVQLYPKASQHHFPHTNSGSALHSEGSGGSRGGNHKKERENEKPQVKLELKIKCAEALWLLSRGSISNSQRITETKGLLCLAKYVEKEKGELQLNCLRTVAEIAGAAELNADLRRAAFKTNSPAAKAVVDQILRVIMEEDNPSLQIPAVRAIGSLARAFQARETRVIGPLVARLDHRDYNVAVEAIIALGKFASPENFLCLQHSKAIIEAGGVPPLVRLLRVNERAQLHGLILLCYLAQHVGDSEALERSRALAVLEGATRTTVSQHPLLRDLIPKALYHLELYREAVIPHRQF